MMIVVVNDLVSLIDLAQKWVLLVFVKKYPLQTLLRMVSTSKEGLLGFRKKNKCNYLFFFN